MNYHISINCAECGKNNKIPIERFYDAFEGIFICEDCGTSLDDANDALDE